MDILKVGKSDTHVHFKNLREMKNYMIKHKGFTDTRSLESMDKGNWSGVYSYDDYLNLLDEGDEKVMDKISIETKKSIAELSKKYKEVIKNYKFDVTGEFFDVGLVMTGVPESWLQPIPEKEEILRVEIILDGTFPDGVDLEKVIKNSGRVLAMVRILEDNGVEVCLKQVVRGHKFNGRNDLLISCNVKNYDEPINYKKCSALVTPTFLRRGYMKIAEVVAGNKLALGYGKVRDIDGTVNLLQTKQIDELERKLFKNDK